MSYRNKRESETWNQFLIILFRESNQVNFIHFLDKYFKDEKRVKEYKDGIEQEKKEKYAKNNEDKKEQSSKEGKVTFAKKPERIKKKTKGYLF